jgi:holliday junction DNA helicase RuvA
MITYLNGILVEKQPTRAVLDVGGVGYELFIPLSSYDRLPAANAACKILTYDHVREDLHQLYGFMTAAERDMFLLLLDISGIGPKMAMTVLSGLSVREIRAAVVGGDIKRLSSISGIGKKTAERIIVELKHKITEAEALEAVAGAKDKSPQDMVLRDAILALIALGYKQAEAKQKIDRVLPAGNSEGLTVEQILKKVLS